MTSSLEPTLFLVSGRMMAFAATFLVPVVLARTLSQAEFGTYKQIFLVYATLYPIAQVGMAESLFYFVPRAPRTAGRYIVNSALFLAAAGVACLAVLAGGRSAVAGALGNDALRDPLALLGVFVMLMMPTAALEIAMIARGRYRLASACYGVSDSLRAMFFLVPVLALGWGIEGLLVGAIAFAVIRLVATVAYVARSCASPCRPSGAALATQLAYALPFGLAGLLEILQATFHQYAVSYRFDAATFAIYAVGCFQIPLVDFVVTSATNVLMVQMSDDGRDGRPGEALAALHRTIRELGLLLLPLVGLLLVCAHDLVVLLFTTSYLASVPIFMIWSVGILLGIVPTDAVLRVYAETRFILGLNVLRLALIAAALPWSLATFGLAGAVTVTIGASAVTKAVAAYRVQRLMRCHLSALVPWRTLATIALATGIAAAVALPTTALKIATLPRLVTATVVFTTIYLAVLVKLGVFTPAERLALARRLRAGRFAAIRTRDMRRVTRPVPQSE